MNTTDLRELLAERAASAPDGRPADARVKGALRKARTIRHRRQAAMGIGALALVSAAVLAPPLFSTPEPEPQPVIEPNEDGFVQYEHGRELIGSASIEPGASTAAVTVTPTAFPLVVVTECDGEEDIEVEIAVVGEPFSGGGCSPIGLFGSDEQGWADRGVRAGEPATFRMTVDSPSGAPRRVAIGIYQDVPWDEYPFPPRPDGLPDLSPGPEFAAAHLTSDPRQPNLPKELILEYEGFELLMEAQTPGILRLRVNGVESDPVYFWGYGYHPEPRPDVQPRTETGMPIPYDTPVRLEVVPEGFSGAWQIYVIGCTFTGGGQAMTCGE